MKLKEGKIEKIIGAVILVVIILIVVIVKNNMDGKNLTLVYGAVGGGKEDFLEDEEFNSILNKIYTFYINFISSLFYYIAKCTKKRDNNSFS